MNPINNILGKKILKDKYGKNNTNNDVFYNGEKVSIKLYHKDDKKWEWIVGYYAGRQKDGNLIRLEKEDGTILSPKLFSDKFEVKKGW